MPSLTCGTVTSLHGLHSILHVAGRTKDDDITSSDKAVFFHVLLTTQQTPNHYPDLHDRSQNGYVCLHPCPTPVCVMCLLFQPRWFQVDPSLSDFELYLWAMPLSRFVSRRWFIYSRHKHPSVKLPWNTSCSLRTNFIMFYLLINLSLYLTVNPWRPGAFIFEAQGELTNLLGPLNYLISILVFFMEPMIIS